jgi:hypothetical protein
MEGRVILEYVFDIGGELELDKLKEKKFKKISVTEKTLTMKYTQKGLDAVVFEMPKERVAGHEFEVSAEIYPVGEIIVRLEKDIKAYDEAEELASLGDKPEAVEKARKLAADVIERLKPYTINAYEHADFVQPYAIVLVKEKPAKSGEWITSVLRHTKIPSEQEISDCTKHSLSYETNDLAVIDYGGAILFDQAGEFGEAIDMINIALVQLIALKTYDALLDKRVLKAYDDLKFMTKRSNWVPNTTGIDRAIREILEAKLEIADMIEDVTSITKISGDWYQARAYNAASDRFKLDAWSNNVNKKMDMLESFDEMLSERLHAEQSFLTNIITLIMEALVVVLIVIEIAVFI